MWLDTFNQMRRKSGMSLDEISEKSGIPKGTLSKITAGITKAPPLETMRKLVHSMGYTLDDLYDGIDASNTLSKAERVHIQKYRLLDPHWREIVDSILDIEYRRYLENLKRRQGERHTEESPEIGAESVLYYFPMYETPMSAGTGQAAGQSYPENVRLVKEPPHGASYVARVQGDSMEPTYRDGDLLFIHSTWEIEQGQVGVFLMDGEQYVKELGDGILISHNPAYDPIPFTEDIQCQGLVLGICDGSYFE